MMETVEMIPPVIRGETSAAPDYETFARKRAQKAQIVWKQGVICDTGLHRRVEDFGFHYVGPRNGIQFGFSFYIPKEADLNKLNKVVRDATTSACADWKDNGTWSRRDPMNDLTKVLRLCYGDGAVLDVRAAPVDRKEDSELTRKLGALTAVFREHLTTKLRSEGIGFKDHKSGLWTLRLKTEVLTTG